MTISLTGRFLIFTAIIRNRFTTFLRGLVNQDYEQAIANLSSPQDPDGAPWTADRLP